MGCETKAAHVPALSPGQELFVRIGLDWSGKYSFFSSRFGNRFLGTQGTQNSGRSSQIYARCYGAEPELLGPGMDPIQSCKKMWFMHPACHAHRHTHAHHMRLWFRRANFGSRGRIRAGRMPRGLRY